MIRLYRLIAMIAAVLTMIFSASAKASNDSSPLYFGAGLLYSNGTYQYGAADSAFNGYGASAIVGSGFSNGSFGGFVEAEFGYGQAINTFQSTTYMEKAVNTFGAAKVGVLFGMVGIGGGIQQNSIDIDNVSTTGTSGRTSYKGLSYVGFARLIVEGRKSSQTILEVKYTTGEFSSLKFADTQLNLRFVFLPF